MVISVHRKLFVNLFSVTFQTGQISRYGGEDGTSSKFSHLIDDDKEGCNNMQQNVVLNYQHENHIKDIGKNAPCVLSTTCLAIG